MKTQHNHFRLLGMLSCLMTLFIAWQVTILIIHYQVADVFQSLMGSSIAYGLLHTSILLPIFANILVQIIFYALIVFIAWLISISIGDKLQLSPIITYYIGLLCFGLAIANLLALNSYYFPSSFFASSAISSYFLWLSGAFWILAILWIAASQKTLLVMTVAFVAINGLCALPPLNTQPTTISSQPNIILIGLDSLRPDFTGFYGNKDIKTPTIDRFLSQSTVFSQAYTPLARTFPAWISILTGQHPMHHGVRNNLAEVNAAISNNTLAMKLQTAGYYTIYATDEKRFSNIKREYGFDKLAGPSMGVNDFIIGSLMDFPLTNLITKLPIAKFILPYNYANRAASITYQPEQFLKVVNHTLAQRPNKPLLLAVHLCVSHWPYTWAGSPDKNEILPKQYQHSVEALDNQLNELLDILKQRGILDNSIVVLLSDHGTGLGLPNDTLLSQKKYHGNRSLLRNIPAARLSNTPPESVDFKHDYSINTSYGQGTNVTSLKQYHTLLAFKRYGNQPFITRRITTPVSLTDIAPTLLAILNLPTLQHSDGLSLLNDLQGRNENVSSRSFFIETADSLSEIETDHIYLEKVLARKASLYRIDANTGLLTMDPFAEKAIIKTKQLAVIDGDWLLARFPTSSHEELKPTSKNATDIKFQTVITPGYYVLANIKTGQWTIGLDTAFAKTAPVARLNKKLRDFYGDEV